MLFHLSIIYSLSLSQWSASERRGTSWTGLQSTAGQHKDTQDKYTLTPNLERPINLTVVFFDMFFT